MLHVIAGFLGGMGLFFMGLTFTGNGVRSLAGRGLRDLLLTWTRNRFSGVTAGIMAGLAFQSTSAISLLLASLVGAGAISVSRALPVMAGSNIGSSFLVLMAVIDIRVLALLMLGASGLAIAFERPARLQHAATILFGVGLILFGLGIVRTSCAPLAEADWFRHVVASQGLPLPVYLLIGTAACLALQTSAGVSILSITLAASGVMDGDDALAVIFGSLFGSSLLSRFYAIRFKGPRKRLVMGQVLFNVVGLCIFLPPFFLEHYLGLPLLLTPARTLIPDLAARITAINIAFDTLTAVILIICNTGYERLLARLCPDEPDSLEALAYARELAGVSPETGLALINKEQTRLVGHLPGYTQALRASLEKCATCSTRDLTRDVDSLLGQIDGCLLDMVSQGNAGGNANAVALLQEIQGALRFLADALARIVAELGARGTSEDFNRLRGIFLEALDALLQNAGEVFTHGDDDAWEMFLSLVKDRGPVMERLRGQYLSGHGALPPEDQWRFLRVTGLFERCVWLFGHLADRQRRFLAESGGLADGAPAGEPTLPIPSDGSFS